LDFFVVLGREIDPETVRYATIGLSLQRAASIAPSCFNSFGSLFDRIAAAQSRGQVDFFFDRYGRPCGSILWTQVNTLLETELLKAGPELVDAAMFNNVGAVWILDFQCQLGELDSILMRLRDDTFRTHESISYFRYKRCSRLAKRVSRSDKTTFLTSESRSSNSAVDVLKKSSNQGLLHGANALIDGHRHHELTCASSSSVD
jgi:hemolysin-activating ACP:hemolysin acyltransferase